MEITQKTEKLAVSIYNSFEAAECIKEEWDKFIEDIGGEIFLSFDWCNAWWVHYGEKRNLSIFAIHDDDALIAVLPFFNETIKCGPFSLRVIKLVGSDFVPISFVFPVAQGYCHDVLEIVKKTFESKIKWDIIYLGALSGKYSSFDELILAIKKLYDGKKSIEWDSPEVQTYFDLAPSWEEHLQLLPYKLRKEMKRVVSKNIVESIASNELNFDEMFNGFVKMHQKHWQALNKPGHFVAWPNSYQFHKMVALLQLKKNRLRLYERKHNGKTVGYSYAFKFGNSYYRFLFAREANECIPFVKLDMYEMIKLASTEKVILFDAMRGDYEYKKQLGGRTSPIHRVTICSSGFLGGLKLMIFRKMFLIFDIMYMKIWRRKIAPILKMNDKQFVRFWVKTHMLS